MQHERGELPGKPLLPDTINYANYPRMFSFSENASPRNTLEKLNK